MALPYWFKSGVGTIVSNIGNNLSANLDLVLLPTGHAPGYYCVGSFMLVRTVALTGTVSRTFVCNAPGGVSGGTFSSTAGPQPTTLGWSAANGSQWYPTAGVISDGSVPIIARYTMATVTGSPVVDFYGFATLLARF